MVLCVLWDQVGVVYYELLKPGETVYTKRYQQQLTDLYWRIVLLEKRPDYRKKQHKVIFLHDNAPTCMAKPVRDMLEAFNWEVLPYAAYSSDLAHSDYHLFVLVDYALAEQHFGSYEDEKKMVRWIVRSKMGRCFLAWYSEITRKMGIMYNKRWNISWIQHFYHSSEFNVFFKENRSSFHTCTPVICYQTITMK